MTRTYWFRTAGGTTESHSSHYGYSTGPKGAEYYQSAGFRQYPQAVVVEDAQTYLARNRGDMEFTINGRAVSSDKWLK